MERNIVTIKASRKDDEEISVMISLQGTPFETQKVMTDIVLQVNDCINNAGVAKVKKRFLAVHAGNH